MEFKDNEAIYLQIAAYVCDNILLEKWPPEQKIPSVRNLAIELEVNPNTVMRTYELLQSKDIIHNKRGIGFFLAEDSVAQVKAYRKANFIADELPQLFRNIYLLNIDFPELEKRYQTFIKENFNA